MATALEFTNLFKTLIRGDIAEHERITAELDQRNDWQGYAEFVGAAFFLAIERRFPQRPDRGAVIRLVAEAREKFDENADLIDPIAAETLVLTALGEASASGLDGKTIGKVETLLVHKILMDENLDDARLNEFFLETEQLSREWTEGRL